MQQSRAQMSRLPVVGVLGSGTDPSESQAGELGIWLGTLGVHLLTGGGGGVMESVSRGFCSVQGRKGLSIGIIPARRDAGTGDYLGPKEGYPNPYVELPVQTHLHLSGNQGLDDLSRNHINILSSNLLIALAGGAGTSSEARLAVEVYHKPLIAYVDGRWKIPGLPERITVEPDFSRVKEFVLKTLAADQGIVYRPPDAE